MEKSGAYKGSGAFRWARGKLFSGTRERLALLFLTGVAVSLMGLLIATLGPKDQQWLGWAAVSFFLPGVFVASFQFIRTFRRVERFQKAFIIRRSRTITLSYLTVCTGWLIGSLLVMIHRPGVEIIALPLSYACALGIVAAFWLMVDWRPVLIINDDGFYDRNLGTRTIPWSEIDGASIKAVGGAEVLCLRLRNRKNILDSRTKWQRLSGAINQLLSCELLHLGMVQIDAQYLDEALDFILARCAGSEAANSDDGIEDLLELAGDDDNGDQPQPGLNL